MLKTGIFGGTFSPVHYGHLLLAEQFRDELELDRVLWIPTGNSYMKSDVIDREHRMNMVSLAVSGNPNFEVSDIETKKSGPTYTADTLVELKASLKDELFFLCGMDTLFQIEKWRNPDIIFQNCTLCVGKRDFSYGDHDIELKVQELKNKYKACIKLVPISIVEISSSEIRERIRDHRSIRYYVPDSVEEYIKENHLYLS